MKLKNIMPLAFLGLIGCQHFDMYHQDELDEEYKLVVNKQKERMILYYDNEIEKVFLVGVGYNKQDKVKEGDKATPEGEFRIWVKDPGSSYNYAMELNYPLPEDAERGLESGLINQEEYDAIIYAHNHEMRPPQYTSLGGLIRIHGGDYNFTWGCVSVSDEESEYLFNVIPEGSLVVIK